MRPECTIPGCGLPHKGYGFCVRHYYKFKEYGDPLATGQRAPRGDLKAFLDRAIAYEGDECTIWPYVKNNKGYGIYQDNGVGITANRYVCERAHGVPPTPKHESAHSCRNTDCITPRHLSWKTRTGNMADQLRDGTRVRGEKQGGSKLTAEKVRAIRLIGYRETNQELADKFGVSHSQISNVLRRKHWRHI